MRFLNFIQDIDNQEKFQSLLKIFDLSTVDELEQAIEIAARQRQSSTPKHQYILLEQYDQRQFSFLFTPMILSVLQYKTVFMAQWNAEFEQVYQQYFRLEALNLNPKQALEEMDLSFDLHRPDVIAHFQYYTVLKALLDAQAQHFIIFQDHLNEHLKRCLQYAGIALYCLDLQQPILDLHDLDFKKLFWKRKTDKMAQLCQSISYANHALVSHLTGLMPNDAMRLIDDLMYSEHLFEKISVIGEFSETIYKNQQEKLNKVC